MAGTYWLTILPDATKLEKGIKDAVKKAAQDIKRDNSSGVGPEVILGDDNKWRTKARDLGRKVRTEMHDAFSHDSTATPDAVLGDDRKWRDKGRDVGRSVGGGVGDALKDSLGGAADEVGKSLSEAAKGATPFAESSERIKNSLDAIKRGDLLSGYDGFGKSLETISKEGATVDNEFDAWQGSLRGVNDGLSNFDHKADGIEGKLGKLGHTAGILADALSLAKTALEGLGDLADSPVGRFLDNVFEKYPQAAGRFLAGDGWHPEGPEAPKPFVGVRPGGNAAETPAWTPFGSADPLAPGNWGNAPPPPPKPALRPDQIPNVPGLTFNGTQVPGNATGGLQRGPGTSTSDSMLARISTGEYIVNAASTSKWLPLLEAMNGGSLARFDTGGYVGDPSSQVSSLAGIPYAMGGFGGGSLDCSGLVSAVVNAYMGRPMFSSRMSTPGEGSWLSGLGARTGRGGAGDLTVLWWDGGTGGGSNGHTEAILPNGQVIEATPGGVKIGAGTTPSNDSQWKQAAYIPKEMLMGAQHPQGGGSGPGGGVSSLFSGASGSGGGGSGSGGAGGSSGGGFGGAPDLGQISSIVSGGLKESLLPQGFSDPSGWADVKSGVAGIQFLTGLLGSLGSKQAHGQGQQTLGDTPAGGILGGLPLGIGGLLGAIPVGGKQNGGTPQSGSPQLAPGQFNPFGGPGGTGAGGAPSAGGLPGAKNFLPGQQTAGGANGGADNSMTNNFNGITDKNAIIDGVRQTQTNRTRTVGPQG